MRPMWHLLYIVDHTICRTYWEIIAKQGNCTLWVLTCTIGVSLFPALKPNKHATWRTSLVVRVHNTLKCIQIF